MEPSAPAHLARDPSRTEIWFRGNLLKLLCWSSALIGLLAGWRLTIDREFSIQACSTTLSSHSCQKAIALMVGFPLVFVIWIFLVKWLVTNCPGHSAVPGKRGIYSYAIAMTAFSLTVLMLLLLYSPTPPINKVACCAAAGADKKDATDCLAVEWPPHYAPGESAVHVCNGLAVQAAPEAVWAWLIRAQLWPSWYENSKFPQGSPRDLAKGTRFRWKTFGVTMESTVLEFVPGERIAWDAHGLGVDAYHAWVLHRTAQGSYILTEETQNGWLVRLGNLFTPGRMHKHHQLWLEGLRDNAAKGLPPAA
jgi:hypothetical protein